MKFANFLQLSTGQKIDQFCRINNNTKVAHIFKILPKPCKMTPSPFSILKKYFCKILSTFCNTEMYHKFFTRGIKVFQFVQYQKIKIKKFNFCYIFEKYLTTHTHQQQDIYNTIKLQKQT